MAPRPPRCGSRRGGDEPLVLRGGCRGNPGSRADSGGGGALASTWRPMLIRGPGGGGPACPGRMLAGPGDVGGKLTRAPRGRCEAGPRLPCEGTHFRPAALQFKALSYLAGVEEGGPR